MHRIESHIRSRQIVWSGSEFFLLLSKDPEPQFLAKFAWGLSFWPLVFQDILRLVTETVKDPDLQAVARHHTAEDKGHEAWFLSDLRSLVGTVPSAADLFAPEHGATRHVAYRIYSEIVSAQSDAEKIVAILALESAGHVLFAETSRYLRRKGLASRFQYFSENYRGVDEPRKASEEKAREQLMQVRLDDDTLRRTMNLVDTCYGAFEEMFAAILRSMPTTAGRARVVSLAARRPQLVRV